MKYPNFDPQRNTYHSNKTPLVALIGLPNSGKSTLLNRITGTKKAIVAKEAHTTRDLNFGEDVWDDMYVRYVDTGGLVPSPEDKVQRQIQIKSWSAISEADLLVWVIDRKQDPETISEEIVQRIWKLNKPYIIALNKVDDPKHEKDISEYVRLGGQGFVNVSATSCYGLNEFLDMVVFELEKNGFEKIDYSNISLSESKEKKKKSKAKEVKKSKTGDFFIVRDSTEEGPGLYESISSEEAFEESREVINPLKNIIFDLEGVVFEDRVKQMVDFLINSNNSLTEARILKIFKKNRKRGLSARKDLEFWENALEELKLDCSAEELMEKYLGLSKTNQQVEEFIKQRSEEEYKLFYLSNGGKKEALPRANHYIMEYFEDGIYSFQVGANKPDPKIFRELLESYDLNPDETLFIDDKDKNAEAARNLGMWGLVYEDEKTNIQEGFERVIYGEIQKIPETPKILLLGKPNVGKSSLFNALCKKDLQIVTDLPGTTLSVNDYLLERTYEDKYFNKHQKKYVLLDTAGIRKSGQRTYGVETFATYRTIQAAHQADIICFLVDASQPITHQDQVVAGICREANKGLVIVANKADLVDEEQRKRFVKDFRFRFQFLKIHKFIWVSATEDKDFTELWQAINEAKSGREKTIPREEVRKLFNYLMKKKPPNKLHNKKRPVIYDLIYAKSAPPTFELLVKDKSTIHWSYQRFLENIIRNQFNLHGSGMKILLKEVDRKKVVG